MRLKLTPKTMLSAMLTHDMQFKESCVREREGGGKRDLAEQTFFTLASNKELLILCVWSGPGNHSSSNLMKVSSTAVSGLLSASEVITNQLVPKQNKQKTYLDQNNSCYSYMSEIFISSGVKRTLVWPKLC